MCRLSRNSGASTSRNPKGLSRPVAGKLYSNDKSNKPDKSIQTNKYGKNTQKEQEKELKKK
jgi:hypothetical protein